MYLFQFINADVYGVFGGAFCDFGDHFEVFDTNGEDPKDSFISNITKVTPFIQFQYNRKSFLCC